MVDIIVDIFNYIFTIILLGIFLAWLSLIHSMYQSFTKTPYLDKFVNKSTTTPKVSVILPARNEECFISKCLETLGSQNYKNFEVIAIDDSSEDKTGEIIEEFSKKDSKIIHVSARKKPEMWMGKNWACMEGFKKATGKIILFTDADTKFEKNVISLAVSHLQSENLDALTVIPRLRCIDKITKITLPMLSTFLHSRYSALNVNNPKKKVGYFFGSFFIIKREVYEEIGTHEKVKQEIIEDGALGKITKESGYALKMVRGEHLIEALYSRSSKEMWNGLKRLMVPLYHQNSLSAIGVFFAVLFILFMPIPLLGYAIIVFEPNLSFTTLLISAIISTITIFLASIMETKMGLNLSIINSIFAPIGSIIVVLGFLSGILQANKSTAVSWRGRKYSVKEFSQNYLEV
jgi:cellulose synthase/poly-beta-1,6-N-acetylglucosamine synthase-like glycosyltransferase|tara:strand:- start:695 stop:1906 length:1212 start_codon:yes stop_codon:yes gene_type:complete